LYKAANILKGRGYIEDCGQGEFRITDLGKIKSMEEIAAARSERKNFQIDVYNKMFTRRLGWVLRFAWQFDPKMAKFFQLLEEVHSSFFEEKVNFQSVLDTLLREGSPEAVKYFEEWMLLHHDFFANWQEVKSSIFSAEEKHLKNLKDFMKRVFLLWDSMSYNVRKEIFSASIASEFFVRIDVLWMEKSFFLLYQTDTNTYEILIEETICDENILANMERISKEWPGGEFLAAYCAMGGEEITLVDFVEE
jgi:hypothetical protein